MTKVGGRRIGERQNVEDQDDTMWHEDNREV